MKSELTQVLQKKPERVINYSAIGKYLYKGTSPEFKRQNPWGGQLTVFLKISNQNIFLRFF